MYSTVHAVSVKSLLANAMLCVRWWAPTLNYQLNVSFSSIYTDAKWR